jgi:hypothetical protein
MGESGKGSAFSACLQSRQCCARARAPATAAVCSCSSHPQAQQPGHMCKRASRHEAWQPITSCALSPNSMQPDRSALAAVLACRIAAPPLPCLRPSLWHKYSATPCREPSCPAPSQTMCASDEHKQPPLHCASPRASARAGPKNRSPPPFWRYACA